MPADQLISCTFNETIGHAFDMYYDAYIPRNDGNKFTIRFESTRWGEDEDSIILHNELKQSDLEVIYNGTNISGSCSLHRNVLITPKLSNSIVINILGAEISEWCDWNTLCQISDEDDADEEHDIVQQYFQVGDYKKAYYRIGKEDPDEDPNPWKSSTFKIIDMHHDSYFGQSSEGEQENKPAAFTFYSNDVNYSHRWQGVIGDAGHILIYKWEDDLLEIRAEIIDMIEFLDLNNLNMKIYEFTRALGILLDNAIEEVINNGKPELAISMYKDDYFIIEIANKCNEMPDFSKIDNKGFTTKKGGHGYGLALLKEICNYNPKIINERKIIDDIFIQIIKIKI